MDKRKRALTCLALYIILKRRRRPRYARRSCWARSWIGRRVEKGTYSNLVRELANEDIMMYRRYFRVSEEVCTMIVNGIRKKIVKSNTNMRPAIIPEERLAITLRFLATGVFGINFAF